MKLCHFFSLVSISKINFISTKKCFPRCVKSERYDYSFKYDKKLLPCLTWWCWIYKLEGLSNFNLLFFINVSTNISKVKEKSLKSWSISQPSGYLSPEAKIIFRTTKLSVICTAHAHSGHLYTTTQPGTLERRALAFWL